VDGKDGLFGSGFLPGGFVFNAVRYLVFFCFVLLLTISVGCVRPFVPAEQRPAPEKLAALSSELKERSDYWRDYQCRFRLRVDSKTSKFSSRAIILVKGRNFVRFETFTPLGQTAALYVSNETGPALLIPSEKAIFTAQRPETLVREFLGVNLPVDLFRWVLAASVPPEQLDDIESRSGAGGAWRLNSRAEGNYLEWQISAGTPALEGIRVSGGFIGQVSYEPPVELTKEAVPRKIRITSTEFTGGLVGRHPEYELSTIEIDVEELKPAPQFQPSLFYMPDLPGARKVDLDKIKSN
jgi:outer membrane biogenesis lipoprotein LolB